MSSTDVGAPAPAPEARTTERLAIRSDYDGAMLELQRAEGDWIADVTPAIQF